jgi:hypothetical protein
MPSIIASGTERFNEGPRHDVLFDKKIACPYMLFLQPDAGYQGRSIAPLAVVEKSETGFVVRSTDGSSRATFDWMAVK